MLCRVQVGGGGTVLDASVSVQLVSPFTCSAVLPLTTKIVLHEQ
jgi:hypothetical protein